VIEYFNRPSVVHRLPPLVKLIGLIVLMLLSICFANLELQVLLLAVVLLVLLAARLPWKPVLHFSAPFLLLAFVVFFIQVFLYPSAHGSFEIFGLKASHEGVVIGIIVALRLVIISVSVPLILMTTKPSNLAKSLRPVLPGFMVFSLILIFRYIPIFQEEFTAIKSARESRGAVLKPSKLHTLFAPLFFKAFKRAKTMSWSVESRGFKV